MRKPSFKHLLLASAISLAGSSPGIPAASAESHPMIGGLIKCSDSNKPLRIYRIPTDGSTDITDAGINETPNGGATLIGDTYYIVYYSKGFFSTTVKQHLYNYDGTQYRYVKTVSTSDTWQKVALDMTYDAADAKIYGCFYNKAGNGYEFGAWEVPEGVADASWLQTDRTTIRTLDKDNPWRGVASHPDGTLYAIDASGTLLKVDKATGNTQTIGDTGLATSEVSSAAIDPANGRFFYAYYNTTGAGIYEINTTTAEATPVAPFEGYQFAGASFHKAKAEGKAPAAVTEPTPVFQGNSLSGLLSFTAPGTTFDGEPASGSITYSITIDGAPAATGTAQCGQPVEAPVTVSTAGMHEFGVTASNAVGSSPETIVSSWVGDDTPLAPQDVRFSYSGSEAVVSWSPVSAGIHDGYVNPDAVTYSITRYPDATVVAQEATGSQWSETLPEPAEGFTEYSYSVAARYAGLTSESTRSNSMKIGAPLVPPYTNSFATAASLDGFTLVNLNNDERQWTHDASRGGFIYLNSSYIRDMDAWVITPRVSLEAGKVYQFSVIASAYEENYTEAVEAFIGTAPTPEGMTIRILEKTDITATNSFSNKLKTLTGEITVPSSGIYYIGIHGCGASDQFRLLIHELSISAGATISAPDIVGDFNVITDPAGEVKAHLTLSAPINDIAGKPLSSLESVNIYRDGQLIKSFMSPTPGEPLNHTDAPDAYGYYTYSATASNAGGEGKPASVSLYVGIGLPSSPESASAIETDTPGEVTISWEAPATDLNGTPLDDSLLTYIIKDENGATVTDGATGTSHTYLAVEADAPQRFKRYRVYAATPRGTNETAWASTPLVAVGTATPLPLTESFTGGNIFDGYINGDNACWAIVRPQGSGAQWQRYTDSEELQSQDGDNGFIGSISQTTGDVTMLYSGKINLAGASNPTLVFHYYGFYGSLNTIDVQVNSGNGFATVETVVCGNSQPGWYQAMVPLTEFAGQTIAIGFRTTAVNNMNVVIDNVAVKDICRSNLTAGDISAPKRISTVDDCTIKVNVINSGLDKASGYTVELFRNDESVAVVNGPEIGAGSSAIVEFTEKPSVTMARTLRYHAVVHYDADEDPSDNTTSTVSATLWTPAYPMVTGLKAHLTDNTVNLTWNAPDMTEAPAQSTTDDFEGYTPFYHNRAGKWTFIDVDGSATHGFDNDLAFPAMGDAMAYTVFTNSGITDTNLFDAHSGNCFLASFAAISGKNDDWAVSPELNGEAQTITFWAKTFDGRYGKESFEFLYSTGGKETRDFIKTGGDDAVPAEWTEYEYTVPAGTRYFAIRCTSANKFIFFVDDVTFTPAGAPKIDLDLIGYNIYRDGVKLNSDPVTDRTFIDVPDTLPEQGYSLSAVYTQGESPLCAYVSPSSAISIINGAAPSVTAADGCIHIQGAQGLPVSVHTPAAVTLFSTASADSTVTVRVLPGVYIVRAGSTTAKLRVR